MLYQFEIDFIKDRIPPLSKVLVFNAISNNEGISLSGLGYYTVGTELKEELKPYIEDKIALKPLKSDIKGLAIRKLEFSALYFEAAVLARNTLEYIPYRDNRVAILKYLERSIKDGGLIVISLRNRYKIHPKSYWDHQEKEIQRIKEENEEVDLEIGDMFFKGDPVKFIHLYSMQEFTDDLRMAGLKIRKVCGNRQILENNFDPDLFKTSNEYIFAVVKDNF